MPPSTDINYFTPQSTTRGEGRGEAGRGGWQGALREGNELWLKAADLSFIISANMYKYNEFLIHNKEGK